MAAEPRRTTTPELRLGEALRSAQSRRARKRRRRPSAAAPPSDHHAAEVAGLRAAGMRA